MAAEKWKILIIDDEEGIRKVLSVTLADAGYEVFTAEHGELGIALCREESPQIVIVDIRMPGIDGIEVLQRIKKTSPEKEIIVVTAYGEMQTAIRALQLNASDFITKPIQDDALFVALERAQEHYRNRKALREYTSLLEERWMDTAEELARTFNFQNNLIESSIDGILGCDKDGRIIIFNKSLEQLTGYRKGEVRGQKRLEDFLPAGAGEKLKTDLRSDAYGGRSRLFLYETHLLDRAEAKIPVQLSAMVLFEGEAETGLVVFFRDLREIRRMEQQLADQTRLLQQDKMISLGRLAASVVHEINNPLTGMLNYIRLMTKILDRRSPDSEQLEKFKRYLTLIAGETERCSKIVSNLLAFSRKSRLEPVQIDVRELLDKCVLLSKHKMDLSNIQVDAALDPNIPKIRGDFNQIQQCIINLVFNAIDAMPEGGTLTLSTSFERDKNLVQIEVRDTGHGISQADLAHIFEPFFTTKTEGKGLGLGLSTVYGIIDRHKGAISVESELGKGTVFKVRLPVGKDNR